MSVFIANAKLKKQIREALAVASQFGEIDGSAHKSWVIDQMVRALLSKADYEKWRESHAEWDEGIPL